MYRYRDLEKARERIRAGDSGSASHSLTVTKPEQRAEQHVLVSVDKAKIRETEKARLCDENLRDIRLFECWTFSKMPDTLKLVAADSQKDTPPAGTFS